MYAGQLLQELPSLSSFRHPPLQKRYAVLLLTLSGSPIKMRVRAQQKKDLLKDSQKLSLPRSHKNTLELTIFPLFCSQFSHTSRMLGDGAMLAIGLKRCSEQLLNLLLERNGHEQNVRTQTMKIE